MPATHKKVQRARLLALARLLHGADDGKGQLPIGWSFSRILEWRTRKSGLALPKPNHECATIGCAIGQYFSSELIDKAAWSRWQPLMHDMAAIHSHQVGSCDPDTFVKLQREVQAEFGISRDEFMFLFMPLESTGGWLTADATPREVSWLIWFFLHSGQFLDREEEDRELIAVGKWTGRVSAQRRCTINDPWLDWWGRPAEVMLRELGYLP